MAWPSIQQLFPLLCPQAQSRLSDYSAHPSPPMASAPKKRSAMSGEGTETPGECLRARRDRRDGVGYKASSSDRKPEALGGCESPFPARGLLPICSLCLVSWSQVSLGRNASGLALPAGGALYTWAVLFVAHRTLAAPTRPSYSRVGIQPPCPPLLLCFCLCF